MNFFAAGNLADVVLGYDTVAGFVVSSQISLFSAVHSSVCILQGFTYLHTLHPENTLLQQNGSSYFGALVGRVANRVAKGRFVLDGKAYHLYVNDGKNAIHGMRAVGSLSCMDRDVPALILTAGHCC